MIQILSFSDVFSIMFRNFSSCTVYKIRKKKNKIISSFKCNHFLFLNKYALDFYKLFLVGKNYQWKLKLLTEYTFEKHFFCFFRLICLRTLNKFDDKSWLDWFAIDKSMLKRKCSIVRKNYRNEHCRMFKISINYEYRNILFRN